VLNGGLAAVDPVLRELENVDGVMLGRAAYQSPELLVHLERRLFGAEGAPASLSAVIATMSEYLQRAHATGMPVRSVTRPMLGLLHGQRGARAWRRLLSDPGFLQEHGPDSLRAAADRAMEGVEFSDGGSTARSLQTVPA